MSRDESFFIFFLSFGERIGRKCTGICLSEIGTCGDQNNGLSKLLHLNPPKSVTMLLPGKRNFASVIK